jgi:uncharacterized membrane protein
MSARRRAAARGGLIGPLALLAGGAVAGVGLWWLLMIDPAPAARVRAAAEQLTSHDQAALDRLLDRTRP